MKNFMNQQLLINKWFLYYSFYDYYIHDKLEKNITFFEDIQKNSLIKQNSNEKVFEYFVNVSKSNETTILPKMHLRKVINERDIVNLLHFLKSCKLILLQLLFQIAKYIQVPDLELYISAFKFPNIKVPTSNVNMKYSKQNMLILLGIFDSKKFNKNDIKEFIINPNNDLNIFSMKFLLYLIFSLMYSNEINFENNFYLKSENIVVIQNFIENCRDNILDILQSLYTEEKDNFVNISYELKKRITRLQTANLLSSNIFNFKNIKSLNNSLLNKSILQQFSQQSVNPLQQLLKK
jgi:hypothetical protein